ncbi:MAG: ABC transporter permease [Trueperaceae bacterium]
MTGTQRVTLSPRAETRKGKGRLVKIFGRNKAALIGLVIIVLYVLSAIAAPLLAPPIEICRKQLTGSKDGALTPLVLLRASVAPPLSCFTMTKLDYGSEPIPPSREAPFGLVEGYDIRYGLVWGTRSLIGTAFIVVIFNLLIGISIGVVGGYFGGALDTLLMRFTDIVYAFPSLILSVILATLLGEGMFNVALSFILVNWAIYARVVRGEVLRLRGLEYIEASRALGSNPFRIMLRHVLPNVAKPIIVLGILSMGTTPLQMSALSFLGIGTPIEYADWGRLVEFARGWLQGLPGNPFAYWYVTFFPGITILLYGLGWSLLGDALQSWLDVRS